MARKTSLAHTCLPKMFRRVDCSKIQFALVARIISNSSEEIVGIKKEHSGSTKESARNTGVSGTSSAGEKPST
ncbi:hypothetical protein R1flu_017475 [Riccia fluitans]|uniref:Uncharacterized protein n=1 Tax=Riccia fluitans TaxID=41844 RepID=A0ABD1ZD98_9MARC